MIRRKNQLNCIKHGLFAKGCGNEDNVSAAFVLGQAKHVSRQLFFDCLRQYPQGLLYRKVSATQNRTHLICGFGSKSRGSKASVSQNSRSIGSFEEHDLTGVVFQWAAPGRPTTISQ
jgi:hypothetical protein